MRRPLTTAGSVTVSSASALPALSSFSANSGTVPTTNVSAFDRPSAVLSRIWRGPGSAPASMEMESVTISESTGFWLRRTESPMRILMAASS